METLNCYSHTTDGWTSRNIISFVTYTIHFINKNWDMENYVISTHAMKVYKLIFMTEHYFVNFHTGVAYK